MEDEEKESQEYQSLSSKTVYHAVMAEGEEELERTTSALFWSGLAAGLSMGFSLVAEGILSYAIPEASWKTMITKFGYSIGFLIVILGRQQLFTENTLTPILPLLKKKSFDVFINVMRLWSVVLFANIIGAALFSFVLVHSNIFDPGIQSAFVELGTKVIDPGAGHIFQRAIFAGWLIALLIWLLPFAETARVWVIILITYVIGIGHFSHIVAGATEVFTLAWAGIRSWPEVFGTFILPALVGNIIGGTVLVALLNHAQVTSDK